MTEKDPTSRPQLRAIQYFFVDGTFEFGFGLLCLILAVYFYLENHTTGLVSALLDASLVLVLIGGAWLVNRLVKRIKENVTYPRTGYVAYRREQGKRRGWRVAAGLLLGGLVGAIGAVLVTSPHPRMNVMPAFTGLMIERHPRRRAGEERFRGHERPGCLLPGHQPGPLCLRRGDPGAVPAP
jgi:hypothetical protein